MACRICPSSSVLKSTGVIVHAQLTEPDSNHRVKVQSTKSELTSHGFKHAVLADFIPEAVLVVVKQLQSLNSEGLAAATPIDWKSTVRHVHVSQSTNWTKQWDKVLAKHLEDEDEMTRPSEAEMAELFQPTNLVFGNTLTADTGPKTNLFALSVYRRAVETKFYAHTERAKYQAAPGNQRLFCHIGKSETAKEDVHE